MYSMQIILSDSLLELQTEYSVLIDIKVTVASIHISTYESIRRRSTERRLLEGQTHGSVSPFARYLYTPGKRQAIAQGNKLHPHSTALATHRENFSMHLALFFFFLLSNSNWEMFQVPTIPIINSNTTWLIDFYCRTGSEYSRSFDERWAVAKNPPHISVPYIHTYILLFDTC